MMHLLLAHQLHKATSPDGSIDYELLLKLVNHTYEEKDRACKLMDSSMQLMSEEIRVIGDTIRKDRDEAIAQSQKRFELAVEGTNDGIWDWDVKKDVVWFSNRCKAMLGYTPDQLTDCSISDWYRLIDPQDVEQAKAFIIAHLNGNSPPALTLRFMHVSGMCFYLMCRASTLRDSSGQVARLVGVHTDITDLIAMQEELRIARDRAESASRAKSDFLANMSHEIRTPMNSVIGMIHLLLETHLDSQQRMWGEIARSSSESLLDIINDILDLSKIEAGKFDLENIPFDLFETMQQVTDTLSFKAQEKNIRLLMNFDPSTPRYVIGDPMRLRQILINLVGNAIKFTSTGHVSMAVKPQKQENGEVTLGFRIEDTGIGIPADKLTYIFEKFSQAEEATTRKFGGTGLGLAICRKLVETMHGEIRVESVLGKGSVFSVSIRLPIDADGLFLADKQASAAPGELDFSQLSILLVEDLRANQIYMHALLKKYGCLIDIAANGNEAVDMVHLRHYDLIFMDCQMPEMDGYAATRLIRDLPLGTQPYIIALTADAMQGDKERCLKAGMDEYLNKPVRADMIAYVLEHYVSRHSQPARRQAI